MFYKARYTAKSRVGLSRRLTALALCACMVFTMSPPITAAQVSNDNSGEPTVISGFAELPEIIQKQSVPLGASLDKLTLPSTLKAYLALPNFGDEAVTPPATSKPDIPQSSETSSGTQPASSTPEESSTPAQSSSVTNSTPPDSSFAEEGAPAAPPSKSIAPLGDESYIEQEQQSPAKPAAAENTPDVNEPEAEAAATQELLTNEPSDAANARGKAANPSAITVEGVTWESTLKYDGDIAGTYIFNATLPNGYVVEDGVSLPIITVTVGELYLWDGTADISWYDAQTESFGLETPEKLAGLAQLVRSGTDFEGKTVSLTSEIHLGGLQWAPIGLYTDNKDSKPFSGTFIGNGHTIHGLTIHQPEQDDLGLFGYSTGVIRDLHLKDVELRGKHRIGGIAAVNGIGGVIEGCTVDGSVLGDEHYGLLVGLDLNAARMKIDYKALVDANKYFTENKEELLEQIEEVAQDLEANNESVEKKAEQSTAAASKRSAVSEQMAAQANNEVRAANELTAMTYVTAEPTLEQLVTPTFDSFDVKKTPNGVQMTAGISDTRGQVVAEYGFVWSLDGTQPTVINNAGMSAFYGDASIEGFTHTLKGHEDALVRGYCVYDGMVSYTGALTTDNMVEADGTMLPVSYKNNDGGLTLVYGQGLPYDLALIQLPGSLWPIGTGFKLKWGKELGREVDPEETIYIIIKGSIVGVPILDIDGRHIGDLQSSANQEYYIIAMKGRDLGSDQNMINILLPPVVPGWIYVDNIQMIFGGGPSKIDGKTAKVQDVKFQGYNFSSEFARYDLTVDGVVKATNETDQKHRLVTSVTVNGNKMYASQKHRDLPNKNGQQTITTNNKCADGKVTYINGTLTLAAAIAAKPPANSAWAGQDPDEVIVSVMADTIQYKNDKGPHEYRLDFDYVQNYYSTGEKGPLKVKATVQSVFGLPVSYIMLPDSNKIKENVYHPENNPDEGLDYAGELKKTVLLIKPPNIFVEPVYGPITVPANETKRVYGYETVFEVQTNGAYEFKVAGPGGVLETFVLEINNIDNQPPVLDVVGAADITMLEDTPFVELGYGGSDNRSLEDNLTKEVKVPEGLNLEKPHGGEYELVYSVTDQAGNKTEQPRKLHIKNRPLDLVTQSVVKSSTSVTMKGNIRYLGDDTIVERGFVWDLGSAPTVDANIGKSLEAYNVHNKDAYTATATLASLIPNATYYCRPYAKTSGGKVAYGAAMSFTANSKNYGVFSITPTAGGLMNSVQTLTITRKDGSEGEQTVHWRTVDGSARADVHYQAASGTVKFAPGETTKTIKIELKAPTPIWKWPPKFPLKPKEQPGWQISPSMFFVELISVSGGGAIDDARRTCKVSYTKIDDIQRTNMNKWMVVSQDDPHKHKRFGGAAFGRRNYSFYPSESPGYNLGRYSYWSSHGRVQGKQQLAISMHLSDSGLDVFVRKGLTDKWTNVASHWYDWGDGEKICQTGAFDLTGQDYVMGRGLSQVRVATSWVEFTNPRLSINYQDTTKPTLKNITALSGDYKADDYIYFAARFSEIVNVINQDYLNMEVALDTGGTVKALYETGSGTDTLVFKLKVPVNSKSAGVTATLKGTNFYIEDLANNKSSDRAGTRLPGVNINSMPYNVTFSPSFGENAHSHRVQITVTKPAGYKGTGAQYQYVFSTSQQLDGATMNQARPFNSGDTVVLDGGTGSFYLHVLVKDSLGVYRTQTGAYNISNGMPAFEVSTSSDGLTNRWTNKPVRVFLTMYDESYLAENKGNLKLYMRDNATGEIDNAKKFNITGATQISTANVDNGRFYFDVTQNSSLALLAVDSQSSNRYLSVITVDCIDSVPPTVELAKDQSSGRVTTEQLAGYSYTSYNPAVYAFCGDADSGLEHKEQQAAAQYQFSASSTPPATGWKEYTDGELLTLQEFFGAERFGSFYLHLRATDKAGNVTNVTHGTKFVVPQKTPPTITVEVEPLPSGMNGFGTWERAYTAAELTAENPNPEDLTGRSAWIRVTLKKNAQPGAGNLAVLMLPGNKNIYDNNARPQENPADKQPVFVDGYEVKDLDPAQGVISIRFPAEKNAIYRFIGSDTNQNSTGFNEGTVIITGIDKNSPIIDYGRYDSDGKFLLPGEWVKGGEDGGGVTLKLSFSDLETPLYGKGDVLRKYIGSEGLQYQIIQGSASEGNTAYTPYDGKQISIVTKKNDTFLVKVRDRIGNNYIQRISVTNIDDTPPYVDTTNTGFGVGQPPIKMQLKYADKEMGLVKVRKYQVTGDTAAPDESKWLDYDGNTLSLRDAGTWYVHYFAQDDVGHVTKGYFGPYTIDSGKPVIVIDSPTSDTYTPNADGGYSIFRDDRYARMHSAQVAVTYPPTVTNCVNEKREYQWSQSTLPSLFGWKAAPAGTADTSNGQLVRFTLESWGSEGVSGRWYLHVRTKGTAGYRGFLFDNDLPVINIIGDNPAYLPRGESYIDRGASAVDAQDNSVAVTTRLVTGQDTDGKDIVTDTKYFETGLPGQHMVTYTATDAAGNSSTAQRVVYIYDNKPPYASNFARETDEDTLLTFTEENFIEHYEDDSNKPVLDESNGEITQHNSLDKVQISTLPVNGALRLDGALVQAGEDIPRARLSGLSYMPSDNYHGTDSFSYQAYDSGIGDRPANPSNKATVRLTVHSVNDAPTADSLTAETDEEQAVEIDLATVIADVEDGTALTVTLGALTAAKADTSKVDDPGTAAVNGQTVTFTPAKDFNGTVRIPYTVTDADSSTATAEITVIVTNVNDAPVMTGELLLNEGADDDRLYRGEQQVTVSWSAASDADNDSFTYRLVLTKPDGTTDTVIRKLQETTFSWSVPKLNGSFTLSVIASDSALDSNIILSEAFVIDSTKPTVDSITPNEHEWGNEALVSVTAAVSDADCGQQNKNLIVEYAADTSGDGKSYTLGAWTASVNGTTVSAEGLNKVRVRVLDAAGNMSDVKTSGLYRLDRTPPTAFTAVSTVNSVTGSDNNAVTCLTVSGKTADDNSVQQAVSGMRGTAYEYKLDSEAYTTADNDGKHTFATLLAPDTQHTMSIRATDVAGNIQTADVTAYTRAQDAQTATLTKWDSGSLEISFTAPANRQGETLYKAWLTKPYSSDKIALSDYAPGVTRTFAGLAQNTKYILHVQSKNGDNLENTAVSFNTDSTGEDFKTNKKPVLTLNDNSKRYYKAGETIILTGTVEDADVSYHAQSAIPTIKVSFGGTEKDATLIASTGLFGLLPSATKWNWTVSLTVSDELQTVPDGKYQPIVTATDNKSEADTLSYTEGIWLDRKAPNIPQIDVDDTLAQSALLFSKERSVAIKLTERGDTPTGNLGNDNPSGFKALRYKLDGDASIAGGGQSTNGNWVAATSGSSISVTDEGHTTITAQAEDNAGNVMESTKDIYIDRTKPTQDTAPQATVVNTSSTYDGSWASSNISVTLTANDTVGIGKIYAKVTDNATRLTEAEADYDITESFSTVSLQQEVKKTIILTQQQQNYIHYMYVDTAGNKKTFVAGPYKIDTTAPAPVFTVNAKELTAGQESVVLRGHGAAVSIHDAGNTGANPAPDHVAGLSKAEFIWLPARVDASSLTTGASVSVAADGSARPADDANGTFSWAEFTSGATLVQGGNINGKWHLWVRLTDSAGNVKCYNESEKSSRPADQNTGYPVFRFDNTAPGLPEKDTNGFPTGSEVLIHNGKTYGSLEVELPTGDDHFQDSNSEHIEYQYTFTTTADPPPKEGLPVFKFESYTSFLNFTGNTEVTVNTAAADTKWSHGVTLAAEFMAMPGENNGNFHTLLDMGGFKVRVSNITGAIVVTDSNGKDKHLGGSYNDGRIHRLVVSAGFGEAIKVYADGKYLGRFWFPSITKASLSESFTLGGGLNGLLYKATLFGRMADDDEGKSFIFRTNDIVGDYVFCAGLENNVTGNTVTDRSGQENDATVTAGAAWDKDYKSAGFLSEGAINPLINLDQYLPQFRAAKELTISTTFKTTKTTGDIGHGNDWGNRAGNVVFGANYSGFDTMYISPYKSTDGTDSGVAVFMSAQSVTISGGDTDWSKFSIADIKDVDVSDGKIHTVTVTIKGDKAQVYVDSLLKTTVTLKESWLTKVRPKVGQLKAGGFADKQSFKGTLYNTHIFGRALTQEEIESGNINYVDKPIALLNYTKEQSGDYGNNWDSVVQTGEGMRFDDSGDYVDLGTVGGMGINAEAVNKNGFSASVRFSADRAKWTGQEYYNSTNWPNLDAAVGQRLFTAKSTNSVSSLIGLGIYGDGSEQIFAYWRNTNGQQQILSAKADGLFTGEHYLTMSYEPTEPTKGTLTLYMDGAQVASENIDGLYATVEAGAQLYVGGYMPAGKHADILPSGAGQFYGTIYNFNFKAEPTTITQHVQEAAKHVTTYTALDKLLGSYSLNAASGGVLKPTAGSGPTATVHGIGDAGIRLNGSQWVEFDLGADAPIGKSNSTFEVVYAVDDANKSGLLIDQQGNDSMGSTTARYMTVSHGGANDGWFGDNTNGLNYPNAPVKQKNRVTGVYDNGTWIVYRDGVELARAYAPTAREVGTKFRLGQLWGIDNKFYFEGDMYDVKVWNKALTPEQVAGLSGYTYDDLVAHFDFSGANPLADKSGHGHDGTMNSAQPAVTGLYPRFDGTETFHTADSGLNLTENVDVYPEITFDTAFNSGNSPASIFQLQPTDADKGAGFRAPLWMRVINGELWLGITTRNGGGQGSTLNSDCTVKFPLAAGRAIHTAKGRIYRDTQQQITAYDITVDNVHYTGQYVWRDSNAVYNGSDANKWSTNGSYEQIIASNGKLSIGDGTSAGAELKGVIYKLMLQIGDVRVEYGPGGRGGTQGSYTWQDTGGSSKHMPAESGITWVPAPANIKGEYPEFMGTGWDFAETPVGMIDYSAPFTVKMKFKPLTPDGNDSYQDFSQTFLGIAGANRPDASTPFFIYDGGNANSIMLYSYGTNTYAPPLGSISAQGNYDLKFTIAPVGGGAMALTGTCNGEAISPYTYAASPHPTNGQILIAYRDYPAQNAHMVLYELEVIQGATKLHYDGTRSFDGTRLIDISGNGNDAAIHGNVKWVTGTPESVDRVVSVPDGDGFSWVKDDLAKTGETIISISNTAVQGEVYLHVWVRDGLGNERQVTYGPFDYDTTRPEISISARKPKANETATSGYVSMSVSDNWLLKNDTTRWAAVNAASRLESPEALFTSPSWNSFNLAAGANRGTAGTELLSVGDSVNPKKYYVAVEAEDWLGNKTVQYLYVDTSTLFDDSQAPTIKFTNIGKNDTYSKRQMVQVDVDDNPESGKTASGVNDQTLQYVWSQSASAPNTGWASFANHNTLRLEKGDGSWYLHVKAADNAGNTASGKSEEQKLDNTAPALAPVRANSAWSNASFTVNAGAADAGTPNAAGIKKIYWASGRRTVDYFAAGAAVDSGISDITAAPNSFTANDNGEYTVYAADNAGNEAVAVYTESKLDKIAPTVSLSPATVGWTSAPVSVSVTCADTGGSGVANVSYTLNGTPNTLSTAGGTVTINTQGTNTLKVTVTDGAGNTALANGSYKLDMAQNEITLAQDAAVKKTHSVQVTVADTASGPAASARYGWGANGASAPDYWSSAVLTSGKFTATRSTGDGAWTLFVESTSATGIKNTASGSYTLDNTAPALSLTLGTEDWTAATTLEVESEIGASLAATLNGTAISSSTRASGTAVSYPVNKNGLYEVTATDGVGNKTTRSLKVTNIDADAPTALLTPEGTADKWFNGAVTVFVTAEDTASGVRDIAYTVNGAAAPDAKLDTDGTHTVAATVTDRAGNSTAVPEQSYKLDSAAPALAPTATVTESTLTVTANATDIISGINAAATAATLEQDKANLPENGTFSGLQANKLYTARVTAADNAGNTATQATELYTLAAAPTGLENVKVLSTGLTATLQPAVNAVAPAYGIKVYKQGGESTPLYATPAGAQTRDTAVSVTFGSTVGKDAVLYMEVTAYNEDGEPSRKTFQITGSGGIVKEVNMPPTITVAEPAKTLQGAADKLTLFGTAGDVNGGSITVTATISGVTKTATVIADGSWTLEWTNEELREGVYSDIIVTAADNKGEQDSAGAPTITVDKTPPLPPKVAVESGWVSNASFTPTPAEGDVDVNGYQYRLNGGEWQAYTESATVAGASGEYMLQVRAVDKAGNIGQPTQKTVRIEAARPSVTCSLPTGGWITANVTAPIKFTDEYKLTAAGWLLSKDTNLTAAQVSEGMMKAEITDGKTASASAPLGNEDGEWYIYALAKDNVGETLSSFGPYQVDRTPPAIPAVTATDITKNSVTLAGANSITDAAAGVDTTQTLYRYSNDTEHTSSNGSLTGLKPNALYNAWLTAADNAGNTAAGASTRLCTLAADPINVELTGRGKDFLTFAIFGDTANATPPEYRIVLLNSSDVQAADSGWSTSTLVRLPVPANAWPVHGIIITRNREKTENLPLDLTEENFTGLADTMPDGDVTGSGAPVLTLTSGEQSPGILHNGDSITLFGTASDTDNDELYVTASIDSVEKTIKLNAGAGERDWTLTWSVTEDSLCVGTFGSYSGVTVTAMDPSDNRASVTDPSIYHIDNAGPQAPTAAGGLPSLVQGTDGEYTVNLNFGVDRGSAGVAEWSYTLDGAQTTGTGTAIPEIVVSGDTAHLLTAYYTDTLGNVGEAASFSFTVDSVPPTLTTKLYTFAPDTADGWAQTNKQPGEDVWYKDILRARYSFSDGTVQYAVTDSASPPELYDKTAQGSSAEITMTEGTHWVHLRAQDAAGNVTTRSFGPYRIDLTPIPVTITVDSTSVAATHTATPEVKPIGDASGLERAQYLWSDAPVYSDTMTGWQELDPECETLTLNGESGTWYLYVRVDDKAGNRTVERSEGVRMDNTPPEITIVRSAESTAREEIVRATVIDIHSSVALQCYMVGSHTAEDFAQLETNLGQNDIALDENGIYTFFAQDQAGNTTLKEYSVTTLDGGIPVITAEGPANEWNTAPFTVTVTITDPDGKLDKVGIIDPSCYSLPAGNPDSTSGYKELTDINSVISPFSQDIDPAHFTIVRPAADMLTDGKLTVSIGSDNGEWYYNEDGGIMLHLAAKDESGNITYGSFGPYRLDNTPPQVTTDTPNTIMATLVAPGREEMYNFTGYAISDNLTKQFVPADATDIIRGPEDGTYQIIFDPAAMDDFTKAKTYPKAVTVTVTDLAGNTTTTVLDCKVCDNVPPVYGEGIKDDATGLLQDNFIEITITPTEDYTFTTADFVPTEGPNRLNEQSLPLRQITLHTLPDRGSLLLNGAVLTGDSDPTDNLPEGDLPKDIMWSDIAAGKLVYRPAASWSGPDTAMGFLAMDSEGNQSGEVYNSTQVRIRADSSSNEEYLQALEKLKAVHIVTNLSPTLADVMLPAGWSFTGDTSARLKASSDNEGLQSFGVKFTPTDPQYGVIKQKQSFPVSTVTLEVNGGLDMRTIDSIGETLTLSPVKLKVTGAPLPQAGDYSTANMEWRSSCPNIAVVEGDPISNAALSAIVTAKDKGVSLIGVAYKGSGNMLGYVLVKVVERRTDSANTVKDITDITGTLETLVNTENPGETEIKAVNAVADEVTKLPPLRKENLTEKDVKPLDNLKAEVNKDLQIEIIKNPQGNPLQPQSTEVVGAAIASGVDSGTVKVYVTPVKPSAKDTKLEIKLQMQVEGKKTQLKAPLFFTMELPAELNTSDLAIWHIKDNNSKPTQVPFTANGQTVAFKLTSFSSLRFNLASTGEPTMPPTDDGSGNDNNDNPVQPGTPEIEKPQPPAQPGNGTADGPAQPGDDSGTASSGTDAGGNGDTNSTYKETQKEIITNELEDAIKNLPQGLTDEQRQAAIEELTQIANAALAALEGTSDPDEARRIVEQLHKELEKLLAQASKAADHAAKGKPFVVLSALFALSAAVLAVLALLKHRGKRRKLFSVIFAVSAAATFLLTSGWSGIALANWWTPVVAAFGAATALGVFVRFSKQKNEDAAIVK